MPRERHPSPKRRPQLLLEKPRDPKVQGPLDGLPHQRSGSSPLLMTKMLYSRAGPNDRKVLVVVSVDETTVRRNNTNVLRTSGTILLDY